MVIMGVEDKFREEVRTELRNATTPFIRFPIGNGASFDDFLFEEKAEDLLLTAIIDYKIELFGRRLCSMTTDQKNLVVNPGRWEKYLLFIIKIRNKKTINVISKTFEKDEFKNKEFLIMITVGGGIKPFFQTRRIYTSLNKFKQDDTKKLFDKGKIWFCKDVSEIPDILRQIC